MKNEIIRISVTILAAFATAAAHAGEPKVTTPDLNALTNTLIQAVGIAGLKKVVETLALRPVQPAKPIRQFLDEDCGLGVDTNGLKLKKKEPEAPTTPPTVQ